MAETNTIDLEKDSSKQAKTLLKKLKELREKKCDIESQMKDYENFKLEVSAEVSTFLKIKKADVIELHTDEILTDGKSAKVRVRMQSNRVITWFVDKLLEVLTVKQAEKAITKTYTIISWPELVAVMKKYNVPAKDVINNIVVDKKVKEKALEQLEAIGEISADDLEDCYKVEVTSTYLTMKQIK